jgi:hypothetical protein
VRRRIPCAVLLAVGLLALPPASPANALDIPAAVPAQFRALVRTRLHMPKPRQGFESRFEIKVRHGYVLSVIGQGDVVAVEVSRPADDKNRLERLLGLDQAATVYVARGTVTPNRIAASFGKFGSVDVRFRPSGRVISSARRRRCRGAERFTNRLGVFVGAVRFSGEKHYVAVRAHRAKGRVRSPLHLRCSLPPIRPSAHSSARPLPQHPSFTPATFAADSRHGVAATELFAVRFPRATFFAELRYGLATARSKVFRFNETLTKATIAPPAPFHGKGVYGAAADGTTSWSGPLSVSFPGAPRTPLTGTQFEVELSAGY